MRAVAVRTWLFVVLLLASSGAQGQVTAGGSLRVVPAAPGVCGTSYFFTGQSVRLIGSGFAASATVEVTFSYQEGPFSVISNTSADSDGNLDAIVMIPAELSTPGRGMFKVFGAPPSGGTLRLSAVIRVTTSPGGDSDGDLVPDICDNCVDDPNGGQEDSDRDGTGDVCDACEFDPANDADGDTLCADQDDCPLDPDNDLDGDEVCGNEDNCPGDPNPSQLDQDQNGVGDACQSADTCSDGLDNDGDSFIDFPADGGCSDANDSTETDASLPCDDGIDNDGDALTDYRPGGVGDHGCGADTSLPENPECDDGLDNDNDGEVDWDGRNGLFTPDESCGGDGSVTNEPEPGFLLGFGSGLALLVGLSRRSRRSRNAAAS